MLTHLKDITGPLPGAPCCYRADRTGDDSVNIGLFHVLQGPPFVNFHHRPRDIPKSPKITNLLTDRRSRWGWRKSNRRPDHHHGSHALLAGLHLLHQLLHLRGPVCWRLEICRRHVHHFSGHQVIFLHRQEKRPQQKMCFLRYFITITSRPSDQQNYREAFPLSRKDHSGPLTPWMPTVWTAPLWEAQRNSLRQNNQVTSGCSQHAIP